VPEEAQQSVVPVSPSLSVSLFSVVRLAYQRKRLVGITAVSVVALAALAALLLPNDYTATVVILPPSAGGASGAAMMSQLSSLGAAAAASGGLSIKNPNDQQVALLKSRTVEDAMAARFHLQQLYHRKYLSTTRKRWERATTIDNGLKDGLIHLSVTDRDPHRAAEMANGWIEEYRHLTATLATNEAAQRRAFFERLLSAAHDNLASAEESLKQVEQRTGVIELDGQAHAMIASAAVLHAQVASKQVEIQAMRQFAADQNPDLERAERELSGLEGQLAAMDASSDRQGGDLAAPKGKFGEGGLEYARALREVKYRETIQELLTRQYEGARVDEARQGALVQVVDPAVAPDRPSSLYRLWILLGALFAALPLGVLAAAAAELLAILRRARRRTGSWLLALEVAAAGGAR